MTNLREVLQQADARHVALGHFNVSDLSGFHAVVRAARNLNVPVLIGVSEGEREFIGVKEIATLVRIAKEEHGQAIFLNADHTHSLEKAKAAAAAGFDEVIFDASRKPFPDNVKETREAVEALKSIQPDLIVEGEVGYIGSSSEIVEAVPAESLTLTTPEEAAQFVAETRVDVLAPAVGNMHGLLPSMLRGEAHKRLDIDRIRAIKQKTGVFLTLHGGSGTDDADFVAGIQAGITIIHINTELRVAWRKGLEGGLKTHAREVTPYKILPSAEEAIEKVVHERLTLFNSNSVRLTMMASRLHARGGPEQLVYEEAPVPQPGPGEVLVRVYATGITKGELSWDETYQNPGGTPRIPSIPGHEVSGVIADLNSNPDGLQVGEEVYGRIDFSHDGAASEFAAVPATNLAAKPKSLDHPHAAAVPLSALTAWQALFDHAGLSRGQRVLIHAAAGGVGTFAVQLAHWRGIYVIATASAKNLEFVRQLGADEVIEYDKARFEDQVRNVDAVLDTVGGDTLRRSWKTLRPGGILISIVEPIAEGEAAVHNARSKFFIVESSRSELTEIARLIDDGVLKTVVAEVVPLERARQAYEDLDRPHGPGKLVIQVRGEEERD